MTLQAQWLDGMRPDWQLRSPRSLFAERKVISLEGDKHLTPSQHLGVLPQDEYMKRTGSKVVLNLTGSDSMKHVEPDDFIIHLRSFQGGIEHSTYRGKVSNAYTVLVPGVEVEPRFFRWALKAPGFVQELATTAEQLRDGQSIRFDQLARVGLPLPSLAEQRRIADFLDDQVTRIERSSVLREDQLRLAAELWETSCGALMQPAHASRVPLKSVAWWREGPGILAENFVDAGVPIMRIAHLRSQAPGDEVTHFVDDESGRNRWGHFRAEIGDLMLSGSASSGALAVWVGEELSGWIPFTGLIRVRSRGASLNPEFMRYFFLSSVFVSQVDRLKQGVGIQHWGPSHLAQVNIPLPLREDQDVVIRSLKEIEGQVATTRASVQASIELLSEYKRSLITASVTGQLDVATARPAVSA